MLKTSRCTNLLLAFALCLLTLTRAQAQVSTSPRQPVARVYLLAGQSNMQGVGQANELSAMWQQPIDGALIFDGKQFKPVVAGKDGKSGRFGPELGFAHYMANNDPMTREAGKLFIIKFALSGQPLDAGWDGGAADGSSWVSAEPGPNRKTFYPGTSADDPNTGLHYKKMMAHIKAGLQTLREQGYEPQLCGVVWMQGEQDAKNEVSAGRYDQSLDRLKDRIAEDLQSKPVPLVFGQVLPHEPAMARFSHRDLIRQRMAEADWRSGSKRAVWDVWMVSTDGMALNEDTVHYSTKGLLELGQAFGLEMLKAHRRKMNDKPAVDDWAG